MKQLKFNAMSFKAVLKDGKATLEKEVTPQFAIVASTKSQNNLIAGLQEQGIIVTDVQATDLFLKRKDVRPCVSKMVFELGFDGEVGDWLVGHIMNALATACVFEKQD